MYEDFYSSPFGKFALEEEAKYIANIVEGKALSIGCGTGIIEHEIMKLKSVDIICIEKNEEMLEMARKRIRAIEGDATWLPFSNERFDAVFFITSLEFIEDYKEAIKEAARVLKKDGIMVAMLLNTESRYFKEKEKKGGYISKNIKNKDIKKIEREIKKYFDARGEYFLCINMKKRCRKEEKALYVIKGKKI